MLDLNLALKDIPAFESNGLRLAEASAFALTQIAGEDRHLKKALGKLPNFGHALENEDITMLRIGPQQVWAVGKAPEAKNCFVTPLSSSRARLLLEGENARTLLATCVAIDFRNTAFAEGDVAMTGIHHTPVVIHCIGEDSFHLYVMRSFALSTWEWLTDAALGLDA